MSGAQVSPGLLFVTLAVMIFCTLLVFAMLLERLFEWVSKRRVEREYQLNLRAFHEMQRASQMRGRMTDRCYRGTEPQDPREAFQEYMPWEE